VLEEPWEAKVDGGWAGVAEGRVTIAVVETNGSAGGHPMTSRNATKQTSALAKARQRRRELDKTRDAHDQRVEQTTADALLALEVRTEAERALQSANDGLGQALRKLARGRGRHRAGGGSARTRRDGGQAVGEARGAIDGERRTETGSRRRWGMSPRPDLWGERRRSDDPGSGLAAAMGS
jgi:hypothetical protein